MIETISDATTIIVNVNYFLTSQKLVRHITEVDAPIINYVLFMDLVSKLTSVYACRK